MVKGFFSSFFSSFLSSFLASAARVPVKEYEAFTSLPVAVALPVMASPSTVASSE